MAAARSLRNIGVFLRSRTHVFTAQKAVAAVGIPDHTVRYGTGSSQDAIVELKTEALDPFPLPHTVIV